MNTFAIMSNMDIQLPYSKEELWDLRESEFLNFAKKAAIFQAHNNPVYKQWITLSNQPIGSEATINAIPFLPISFFKNQDVFIGERPITLFESSGTTQDVVSKHWVADTALYQSSFLQCFELFYGNPKGYCIIGLLPNYLERQHSSLVYMVNKLIELSGHEESGFYLNDFDKLNLVLKKLEGEKVNTWFIGVSFALIDFSIAFPQQLNHTTIIETGGMKGRKEELSKQDLHALLSNNFGVQSIHSEYGMTELLSQAYSSGEGIFKCPPWMKVLVGELEDPTSLKTSGRGILHIIDLANVYSCSFIATEDLGEVYEDGSFSILGRVDHSDRRGCSLLVV
jgi:hypothetical protein